MKTITIERQQTNITALDETLETILMANYLGLSVHSGKVRVHLLDATPSDLVKQAEALVQAHDPSQLTIGQQAEITQRQNLMQSRADNNANLDVDAYISTDPLVQELAHKISWLEQEIRDLRDL